MSNPKVCVIMPVYNGAKTLPLALQSMLRQSYSNWECVIVNDGSTDGTKDILDSLLDPRFKVVHLNKNVGRGAARQICLNHAAGKYLAYLDADDFYHKDKLSKQVEIMETNPDIHLVSCAVASYNTRMTLFSKKGPVKDMTCHHVSGATTNFFPPSAMVYLDKAKEIQYDQIAVSEDTRYFAKYLLNCKYHKLSGILYYYYEVANTKKLIQYQYEVFVVAMKDIKRLSGIQWVLVLKELAKLCIKLVVIPVMGSQKFIARRGVRVSDTDINTFEQELNACKKYSL